MPRELQLAVPQLAELDLAGNLISSWSEVAKLAEELPRLRFLNLSHSRLSISPQLGGLPGFAMLHTLVLNSTGITWEQVSLLCLLCMLRVEFLEPEVVV